MIINIDWLQIHTRGKINRNNGYTFELLKYSTQVFEQIENLYLGTEYIASICSSPKSHILHPNTVIIKFINRQLYSPTLFTKVDNVLNSLHLEYKGITRLDIAADVNKFKNGLMPENLISKFMKMEVRKIGYTKGKVHFEQSSRMKFETLKFGSGTSPISCYLYNKTKELKDVKMKPYIMDAWKASGLDTESDVWRLEFSIKGNNLFLKELSTGENIRVDIYNIRNPDFLRSLFYSLQFSYFRFKLPGTDKNISRWKDLEILPNYTYFTERVFITETEDSTRSDKIFLKKLDKINDELRNYANYREDFLKEFTAEFCANKGLTDYYLQRVQGKAQSTIEQMKSDQLTIYEKAEREGRTERKDKNIFHQQEEAEHIRNLILKPKMNKNYN